MEEAAVLVLPAITEDPGGDLVDFEEFAAIGHKDREGELPELFARCCSACARRVAFGELDDEIELDHLVKALADLTVVEPGERGAIGFELEEPGDFLGIEPGRTLAELGE